MHAHTFVNTISWKRFRSSTNPSMPLQLEGAVFRVFATEERRERRATARP